MSFWETGPFMKLQTFLFAINTQISINYLLDMDFSNLPLIIFQFFFGVVLSSYLLIDGILNFNGRISTEKETPE